MQLSWPLSVAIAAFLAAATVANHDRVGRAVTRARLRDFYAREGEEKSDAKLEKLLSTQCRDEAACDKALRKKYGRGLPDPGNLLTVLDGDVLGAYTYRASSAATEAWAKYRDLVPVDPLLSTPRQILATLRSGSTYLTLVVATCTCGFVAPLVPAHRAWLLLPLSLAWLGAVVVVAQPTPAELEPATLAAAARAAFESASVVGRLGLIGAAFSALRALLGREHAGPLLVGFVLTILAMTRPTDHPPYDELDFVEAAARPRLREALGTRTPLRTQDFGVAAVIAIAYPGKQGDTWTAPVVAVGALGHWLPLSIFALDEKGELQIRGPGIPLGAVPVAALVLFVGVAMVGWAAAPEHRPRAVADALYGFGSSGGSLADVALFVAAHTALACWLLLEG